MSWELLQKLKAKFTPDEVDWLEGRHEALRLVAEYHEYQITIGEPTGCSCQGNYERKAELLKAAQELEDAANRGDL